MKLVNPNLLPEGAVSIRVCENDFTLFNKDDQYWSEVSGKWEDLDCHNMNFPRYELFIDLVSNADPYIELSKLSIALRDERVEHKRTKDELGIRNQELSVSKSRVLELVSQEAEMKRELQQVTASEQFYSDVVHGEVKDFQIECDEGKEFFVTPRVIYDVCTETETHVPDCISLEEAQRYCKQLNIEDRMGNGRVDFGGETPNDLTSFIESNEQMIRNILTLSDDVLAYLATLPDEDE